MTKLEIRAKKLQNRLDRLFPEKKARLFTSAIVCAAGDGKRFGGVSKPFYPLNGKPCLAYSLRALEMADGVCEIVVVSKKEDFAAVRELSSELGLRLPLKTVEGGKTRQESVANGFLAVDPQADLVLIHDAARPCISPDMVELLLRDARRYGAATASCAVVDTVKKKLPDSTVGTTVPREELALVQTPQVFAADLYRVSLALAQRDGFVGTDDNALAENAGFSVHLTDTGSGNCKLTYPDDAALIEKLLKEE